MRHTVERNAYQAHTGHGGDGKAQILNINLECHLHLQMWCFLLVLQNYKKNCEIPHQQKKILSAAFFIMVVFAF